MEVNEELASQVESCVMLFRKLHIPIPQEYRVGGPMTFMGNLQRYLDTCGYSYSTRPYFAKGIFFPVTHDKRIIRWIKTFGGKVIQRLDGVYYPSQHGPEYESMNRDIEDIYRNLADFVVFQSEYSRKQAFEMMGEKDSGRYAVIHNGVDEKIFFPSDRKREKGIIFVMSGNFRKLAMLVPVVLALDSLRDKLDFRLRIAGPITCADLEPYLERDYIDRLGALDHEHLAGMLRSSDIFIHCQLNDNCPNAVLEAVSCGLPVVGFASGAMEELLFFNKNLLAYVSEETFQRYEDFDPNRLAEKIVLAVKDFEVHKRKAMENAGLYPFSECGRKYIDIFKKVLP